MTPCILFNRSQKSAPYPFPMESWFDRKLPEMPNVGAPVVFRF